MNALQTVVRELIGLFIEDRLFALAIAAWLLVAGAIAAFALGTPEIRGLVLLLGLAGILVGGVAKGAR